MLSLLLVLATTAFAYRNPSADIDLLPGWMGSEFRPAGLPHVRPPHFNHLPPSGPIPLDWNARIFLWPGFLSPEEADHIRQIAEPNLLRSWVADNDDGHSELSNVRTSKGTFLRRRQDPIITRIENRIAMWTLLPVEHGEGLQVLRYKGGEKYDAHYDYFHDAENVKNGGNRVATVLMYLADTEEGGETAFPHVPAPGDNEGFSECARPFLAAKPKKGDAILFHSMTPEAQLEEGSMHVACPVIRGEKWSAAKWIHVRPFDTPDDGATEGDLRAAMRKSGTCSVGSVENHHYV